MIYSASIFCVCLIVLNICYVSCDATCLLKTDGPRYTTVGDNHVNATLTFSIKTASTKNCKPDGVQILVTNSNGNKFSVCQFVKIGPQSFFASYTASCAYDDRKHEFSLTRAIKTTDTEIWHLVAEVQGASTVTLDVTIRIDPTTATVLTEPKQKATVTVEESDKKNDASSSLSPDLLVFVFIGAIGGFFVIIIALIAVLFAVLFRKRERRRTRRDEVPTAPPVPCQFRRRHPALEPTVVFTQRPLPDPLLAPPTPPPQPPALTLQRQHSSDYTPLGETEHFYFRIPERKSDSSRSCKTASSLTSMEDSSGGYMIPPEPRSLHEEAEGAAASAGVTTTVAGSSDYLHPVLAASPV